MRDLFIAIWTHSCMVLSAARFPWLLRNYDGSCSRISKGMDFRAIIPLSPYLELDRKFTSTLRPRKGSALNSIFEILGAQPKGFDMKFYWIDARWHDSINKPHKAALKRVSHKKKRTIEKDYEASIRAALAQVKVSAIKLGVKPPFLTSSYMVIETIDGLPMDHYEEDYLYTLIGTQLWNDSPLSRVLYDVIEHTITKRGVSEYRVLPRDR